MDSADKREQSSQVESSEKSNNSPTLSKTETLRLLNESIDRLESTIKAIGKSSTQELPSSDSIESLLTTTQELAESVTPTPAKSNPEEEEVTPPQITESPPNTKETVEPSKTPADPPNPPQKTQVASKAQPPRSQTPKKPDKITSKQKKQEARGLKIISTIAILIAIVGLIWLFYPQIQTQIAAFKPDADTPSIANLPASESESIPPAIAPSLDSQSETPSPQPIPQAENSQDLAVEPTVAEEIPEPPQPIPQDLKSPGRITNLKITTIEPELTFTPEQNLIASLQAKLAELADSHNTETLDLIKVEIPENTLSVKVTDKWYELDEASQNKLGDEILQRSRQFKFERLKLEDSAGTLVARNPVVGDRIIILQSSKTN